MSFNPDGEDVARRDEVVAALLAAVRNLETVKLPAFDPELSVPEEHAALLAVGSEPNPFGGHAGEFRYQLEGEDDLLHLIVSRIDGGEVPVEDAQAVAAFVWPDVPRGLVWAKPGTRSHHFYIGHDVLLEARG
ncbi:MAG: hypothetical protein KF857_05800 [Fimbriimonadaceae bacterium]|nr:hypothetical protein [Fimbriimonadaceae bacterium]